MAEKELKLYSCEYIMDTAMTRNKFIVDKMLYSGLYILAGAPKVGNGIVKKCAVPKDPKSEII